MEKNKLERLNNSWREFSKRISKNERKKIPKVKIRVSRKGKKEFAIKMKEVNKNRKQIQLDEIEHNRKRLALIHSKRNDLVV